MDLSENSQKDAARILGRDISAAEKGGIISLDAFTETDVAEIRKLGDFNAFPVISVPSAGNQRVVV